MRCADFGPTPGSTRKASINARIESGAFTRNLVQVAVETRRTAGVKPQHAPLPMFRMQSVRRAFAQQRLSQRARPSESSTRCS